MQIAESEEISAYCEEELLVATEMAIELAHGSGSLKTMLSAAKYAYNAVSKCVIAIALPGKALSSKEIIDFETANDECCAELDFQIRCFDAIAATNLDKLDVLAIANTS